MEKWRFYASWSTAFFLKKKVNETLEGTTRGLEPEEAEAVFTASESNGLVYKPHPRFLAQNFGKKVQLIHESLWYIFEVSRSTSAL